ncbi:lipase member H isoform X1 [Dunckerocampus dactyliophorus]|uniref:lipase member H isoform X1 n=1 Tax=Dunckerocampus dactyliophorus TaxID=161453 RepID=UPI002405B313|nr:lipase member H isoform X1 [Dunckerocampus dactyliophorus]XP_054611199.1 lipase member H isoform X1 [Dunckerocampus dactyliophorus]XP_054611200.1 lipase member H isoform X1 [Dunckerocampus dactyliophorus]XP_054611201.1 lipase member H isoform X1 [Dunckerocampus dactyliophorus]
MSLWRYLTLLLAVTVHICQAEKCDDLADLDLGHAIIGTTLKMRLLLFTRDTIQCGSLLSHSNLSANPNFNLSRPTTFIIHGYRPTGSPPVWAHQITEQLLARKDLNVIIADWNYGAANVNYFKAVENTHKAAHNLTAFFKKMQEHGASLSDIHMIGISLGAHISGFVGANLNGTIGRITALDPAGPQFTGTPPKDRLDPTDALFVDALHTDIDALGYREALGHIDFYANGGTDQPGCPKTIFSGTAYFKCDHQRSVYLYCESLNHTCSSRAFPCASYRDFMDGNCMSCDHFGDAGCPVFGYDIDKWKDVLLRMGQTKTFFFTNKKSPFCMTNYRLDVVIWNQDVHWGYITVKLHGNGTDAVAKIDHKESQFKKYTETKLFAQFDTDLQSVNKMSLLFSTGNVFKPKYKLRVLRIRLTHLERNERYRQTPAIHPFDILPSFFNLFVQLCPSQAFVSL